MENEQDFLVTIMNREGEILQTEIYTTHEDRDTVFWNFRLLIDTNRELNVEYLGVSKKPRKLIPLIK